MLIGGVVIMSLTLIGVSERRKEIGVRRSVGANRGDILFQFLAEAMLVATCGRGIWRSAWLGWSERGRCLSESCRSFFLATLWRESLGDGVVGVGLLFGIYPAWRASRVDPVRALRA